MSEETGLRFTEEDLIASFRIPKELRIGQALFIFLVWLVEQKEMAYYKTENGGYLADTFNISDADFASYYNQWYQEISNV